MIAVCLLTADRFEYTNTTLRTFSEQNDRDRFMLLHADDASRDSRVPALAHQHGFVTVAQTQRRHGWLAMRRMLFAAAARRGAEWILFLENDVEWARPFPWALFEFLREQAPSVYCLRLQGQFKDRFGEQPCMVYHKDDRRKPVKWKPIKRAPEASQVGQIHWSAQPCVTRTQQLIDLHTYGLSPREMTARVVENVTYHIGAVRTSMKQKPAQQAVMA